jgi:phosphoglycolate phosphatase
MRLAIFDFDGTLVDTAPWFFATLNTVADRHGFRTVNEAEGEALRALPTRTILARLEVPFWKIPRIAMELRAQAMAEEAAIPLFPWVPDLLADLAAAGLILAIASSNGEAMIRHKLGTAMSHVAHLSAGASLFGKPERLSKLLAASRIAGAETCVIGDEIRDVEAARSIGARSIAVTWGLANQTGLQSASPDLLVTGPAELRTALLGLARPA